MPKLKPETLEARRAHILDAAEICFARAGFHGSTMQDICKEAGVSPGALYVHFSSKEALIAGIVERDRAKLADELAELANAPGLIEAMARLGERYTIDEPRHKRILCIEIGAESTRNEQVREVFSSVDRLALSSLETLSERARDAGRITPDHDPATLAQLVCIIGDGMFWRRATDPDFDAKAVMPAITALLETLLNETSSTGDPSIESGGSPGPVASQPEKLGETA